VAQRESVQGSIQEYIVEDSEIDGENHTNSAPTALVEPEPEPELVEEDVDLEIVESMSSSTFLYSYMELTTTKRKRMQVCEVYSLHSCIIRNMCFL